MKNNYAYAEVALLREIPVAALLLDMVYQWMQNIIQVNLFYRR